jgi:AAA+ superfamily predicted ATPase
MGFWDNFKEAYRSARYGASSSSQSATVRVGKHLSSNRVTIGILLLIFGILQGTPLLIFGISAGISLPLSWLALGIGLLLLTWHRPIHPLLRVFFYLPIFLGVFGWLIEIESFVFRHPLSRIGVRSPAPSTVEEIFECGFCAIAIVGLILVAKHRPEPKVARVGQAPAKSAQDSKPAWSNIPSRTFADVGGLGEEKRRIATIVNNRLHPERFAKHGAIQNGVLLYGPRGTGKTFVAEATAGEFKVNFWPVSPTKLIETWVGNSEANIRRIFEDANACRPVVFFIDELDSIGTQRQQLGRNDDRGGAARAYNAVVTELMQCIDRHRTTSGFIIMAATNFYDSLDEALVRERRFDERIRINLPNETARIEILTAQLSKRPWKRFALDTFAKQTPGWNAAKLTNLVNRAAGFAAAESRQIERNDLERAFEQTGGADRPNFKCVNWDDLVLPPAAERDLRDLISLMNADHTNRPRVLVPTGLLLVGILARERHT